MNPFGCGLAYRLSRRISIWVALIWVVSVFAVAWFYNSPLTLYASKDSPTLPPHHHDVSFYWVLVPMVFILPALAWVIFRIANRELAAVEHIAEQIETRGGSNLTPIKICGASLEMNKIAVGTNRLLSKLDEALHAERALAANAAHELRTPLAAAKLSLSTAQSYPMSQESKDALEQLTGSLNTLSVRAEKLLQLSRAEATATLSQDEVDLSVLALRVTQEFLANPSVQSRLKLELPEDQAVIAFGNFDTIAIALRNLIENALKYAATGVIHVSITSPATLMVRDEGLGVPEADLSKLRTRHVRLSPDQTGYGLGLSIVRTIAEKNNGSLVLRSPPLGFTHGFEAVLRFNSNQL